MTVVVGVDGFPPSRTALRLELGFGVKAAGKPLEQVAAPLSEIDS